MKQYLPSHTFMRRVAMILLFAIVICAGYTLVRFVINKFSHKDVRALVTYPGGTIQKDSNNNGIPDWEERLWGLDPTADGTTNKSIIDKKKSRLTAGSTSQSGIDDNGKLTEDDEASRQFFAAVMSLQESGKLTDQSILAVADSIGEKIVATPIDDVYKASDVTTDEFSKKNLVIYYNGLKSLFIKYRTKNIGDELTFIEQGLQNNDPSAMRVALGVASQYKSFGKELLKIPVPKEMIELHLNLANNYEKVGESIEGMSKVLDEPIVGMRSFINYNKYLDLLTSEISELSGNSST